MSDTAFNTGTRNTPLGDPKAGASADLDALADYVSSLTEFPKSHRRQTNGAATLAGENGRQHFLNLQCNACHSGADFTDSAFAVLHNVGTIKPSSGQRLGGPLTGIDTPTLRGIADTSPYLHDGSASDLTSVFNETNAPTGTAHAGFRALDATQQNELLAFLLELDGSDAAPPIVRPSLDVNRAGDSIELRWPTSAAGFQLLSAPNLNSPINWSPVTNSVQNSGSKFTVTLPASGAHEFFLLRQP
jgi:hypothetical protein